MEALKNFVLGILGIAAVVFYIAVSCMLGVVPIVIGFWLWNKVL